MDKHARAFTYTYLISKNQEHVCPRTIYGIWLINVGECLPQIRLYWNLSNTAYTVGSTSACQYKCIGYSPLPLMTTVLMKIQ